MTTRAFVRSHLLPCTGLVVPPTLWAMNTQLGQVLPYVECGAPFKWAALSSFPAAAVSLAAAIVSWQVARHKGGGADLGSTPFPVSFEFVGMVSALAGALFAFALILQGLAALVLTGCER